MVFVGGNGLNYQSSIQDEAVCILQSGNTPWKGMNLTILPSAMGKLYAFTRPFRHNKESTQGQFLRGI